MKHTFKLVHVGINTPSPDEATKLAALLSDVFNLAPRHGQKSEFAGDYFECLRTPYLGANGHIAMRTDDLEGAVAELKEKGYGVRMDTAAYTDEGKLKNIYLEDEFGGFAIHIMQK